MPELHRIITAIYEVIMEKDELKQAVFGSDPIPMEYKDTILAISSLDFVDLIIGTENKLGIEMEGDIPYAKISIAALAERMIEYA